MTALLHLKQNRLPPIAPVKACDHSKFENEISRLRESIDDLKERHLIEMDQLKGQLNDKISKAMEHSADLNRLQNLCRQLQAENAELKRRSSVATPPARNKVEDLKPRVLELESQVADYQQLLKTLQKNLSESERTAASCAHIAKVKDEQLKQSQGDLEKARKRQKETLARLFELNEQLTRERESFEEELRSTKAKSKEFQDMLKILKAAWTKRESEWLAYDKERNEKWKAEAQQWLNSANGKLEELRAGSSILKEITLKHQTSSHDGS